MGVCRSLEAAPSRRSASEADGGAAPSVVGAVRAGGTIDMAGTLADVRILLLPVAFSCLGASFDATDLAASCSGRAQLPLTSQTVGGSG
jgi:hypothetical protein